MSLFYRKTVTRSVASMCCVLLLMPKQSLESGYTQMHVYRSRISSAQNGLPAPHALPANTDPLILAVSLAPRSGRADAKSTLLIQDPHALISSECRSFTLQLGSRTPSPISLEVRLLQGVATHVVTLLMERNLPVQDAGKVSATLCPSVQFGPNAFGTLQIRARNLEPLAPRVHTEHEPPIEVQTDAQGESTVQQSSTPFTEGASNWFPLGKLVRLPTLETLNCPKRATVCVLRGLELDLIIAVSASPNFDHATQVSASLSGRTLSIPRVASTLFLRLRDDPDAIAEVTPLVEK